MESQLSGRREGGEGRRGGERVWKEVIVGEIYAAVEVGAQPQRLDVISHRLVSWGSS